jgi:DNA-binding response OmpR family regulator
VSRVLIVDDEKPVRDLIREAIQTWHPEWQVDEASDGVEAVERAIENPPDLILLDIVMPDMGGLLVCQKVRQNVSTMHTRIIFITGKRNPSFADTGFSLGCDDFVVKPFELSDLIERANRLMQKS